MKILLLNTSDNTGGAAIATYRLMKALQKKGMDANMLVLKKGITDNNIYPLHLNFFKKWLTYLYAVCERLLIYIWNGRDKKKIFYVDLSIFGNEIQNHPLVKEADILHLHWINHCFLSIKNIHQITRLPSKSIIWTMHDMWPCTGICHHAGTCEKFKKSCFDCPYLEPGKKMDWANYIFKKKAKLFLDSSIQLVCCSNWLKQQAEESALTSQLPVHAIPNPIDVQIFRKEDPSKARNKFNLPLDKKLILFGAANVSDERKGIHYLIESLTYLDQHKNIELVVFGETKYEIQHLFPIPLHFIGYLTNKEDMISLYNAVNLFVTPSLEENLPNTIMEAMACGTPCIGFNIGGIPEMIDHKKNGYIATYKDAKDFAKGIQWVLENDHKELTENAITKVKNSYTEEIIADKYINLYQKYL